MELGNVLYPMSNLTCVKKLKLSLQTPLQVFKMLQIFFQLHPPTTPTNNNNNMLCLFCLHIIIGYYYYYYHTGVVVMGVCTQLYFLIIPSSSSSSRSFFVFNFTSLNPVPNAQVCVYLMGHITKLQPQNYISKTSLYTTFRMYPWRPLSLKILMFALLVTREIAPYS